VWLSSLTRSDCRCCKRHVRFTQTLGASYRSPCDQYEVSFGIAWHSLTGRTHGDQRQQATIHIHAWQCCIGGVAACSTRAAFGLDVPATLLARATEVIE